MSRRSNDRSRAVYMRVAFVIAPILAAVAFGGTAITSVADETAVSQKAMDAALKSMWPDVTPEWQSRIVQDDTQKACSRYRNDPPTDVAKAIIERETASIHLPADGNVLGDWKEGEKIASNGRGGQFSDPPDTVNGGNCYACHELAKSEMAFGTLGPSLTNYGRVRNFDAEAAKATFAKIYDSEATMPCSNMPRFGTHKFLTEKQIKDVVAFLFSPDSPVNK